MAIRESQVANGASFLSHPNVQGTPIEERIEFLKGKGLTQEEIDEALSRANQSTTEGATGTLSTPPTAQTAVPPMYSQQPPPIQQQQQQQRPSQPWWVRAIVPANLALFAGAGIVYLYRNLVLHERPLFGRFQQFVNGGQPPNGMGQQQSPPAIQNQNEPKTDVPSTANVPFNSASMYGTAPYAQNASASNSEKPAIGNATDAIVPYSGSNGSLIPKRNPDDEQLSTRVVEKQIETLNIACEAMKAMLEEIKDMRKEQVARGGNASSGTDAAMLQTLLAMQANQASTTELKSDIAAIKELLTSKLGASELDFSSSKTSTCDKASQGTTDKATPDKKTESPIDALLKAASAAPTRSRAASSGTTSSTEGSNKAETSDAKNDLSPDEIEKRTHTEKSREALAKMVQATQDSDKLVGAVNLLLMYLKNLVKDPDTPRLRRIARTNAGFKKSLLPVDGHLEFLKSLGFAEKSGGIPGLNSTAVLEWQPKWLEGKDGWAKEVLQDAIQNLETVKSQNIATSSSTSDRSSEETKSVASSGIKIAQTNGVTQTTDSINVGSHQSTSNTTGEQAGAGTQQEPEYPPDFAEVMRMQAQGIRPPGIKDIPSHLSTEAEQWRTSKTSSQVPSKPWEKAKPVPSEPQSFADIMKSTESSAVQASAQLDESLVNSMTNASDDTVQEVSSG